MKLERNGFPGWLEIVSKIVQLYFIHKTQIGKEQLWNFNIVKTQKLIEWFIFFILYTETQRNKTSP